MFNTVGMQLGGREVLHAVTTTLSGGELVGLIGANGSGKTTLMRLGAGLLHATTGQVNLAGQRPERTGHFGRPGRTGRRERARRLGYLPQGAPCHWPLEVSRLVALGRLPHLQPWQRPGDDDAAIVTRAMQHADVTALAQRDALSLSGGERARVMLARVLAGEPELLLADEPAAGLDPAHQLSLMQALHERSRDGMGVLVSLHDLGLAARFCDRLLLLRQGRLLADGKPAAVLTEARLAEGFGIEALTGVHDGQPYLVPWKALPGGDQRG